MSTNGRTSVLEPELEDELELEDEYEVEDEDESEEFLGGLVSGLGGLLGQSEDEYAYEDEGEEFFGKIGGFLRRAAPMLKSIAKVAAPMVGTALLGPLGGTLGGFAAKAL